jgi:chromate transporter
MAGQAGPAQPVTCLQLFLAFGKIGVLGFGGVAAWVRQIVVEERGWLDDRAFTEMLGVSNVLPGANTVNLAALLGDRFCGLPGVIAALCGLVGLPMIILIGIAIVYDSLATNGTFQAALAGAGAGAAGLVLGNGFKLVRSLQADRLALAIVAVVCAIVGFGGMPLVPTLLIAAPISIALFAGRRRLS